MTVTPPLPAWPEIWKYSIGTPQTSGRIYNRGGLCIDSGPGCYSGYGPGKNNRALQHMDAVGPIPEGFYSMVGVEQDTETGPDTIILEPAPSTEMYGRGQFRIHGDSKSKPGQASRGCIVANDPTRRTMIASFKDLPEGDQGRKLYVQP